jgi:hypothetical protein
MVEIHEAAPLPGGMMHFGIPAYRLPREVLMHEVRRIETLGIPIVLNHRVDENFDAVFVAIGAGVGRHVDVPARDAVRVLDAVSVPHSVKEGEPPRLGRGRPCTFSRSVQSPEKSNTVSNTLCKACVFRLWRRGAIPLAKLRNCRKACQIR